MKYKADPITMQVIRYAMEQVAEQPGLSRDVYEIAEKSLRD